MSAVLRRFLAGNLAALCVPAAGCAASQTKPQVTITPAPTSQPAEAAAALDVQQLSGQIVAGVQAELSSRIETAVETTLQAQVQATGVGGNATGYNSEFGVGATLVVSLTLLLALLLSHRRETLRIKQGWRPEAGGCSPNCWSRAPDDRPYSLQPTDCGLKGWRPEAAGCSQHSAGGSRAASTTASSLQPTD